MVYEPWMPLFAPKTTRWLRYSTEADMTSTSGVPVGYVIRANDLFDPDFTSSGHQPMGFDQMMLFYNHFCVIRSKIRVVFRNLTAPACTVCIRVDADSSLLTTIDRIVEFGGCVTETCEATGGYGANKELMLDVSIPRVQGVPLAAILADANLRGTAAASPSEVSYFHLMLWNTNGVTAQVQFDIILEQEATFTEPRDITSSLAPSRTAGRQEVKQCEPVRGFTVPFRR
jgi:hypothetical protein